MKKFVHWFEVKHEDKSGNVDSLSNCEKSLAAAFTVLLGVRSSRARRKHPTAKHHWFISLHRAEVNKAGEMQPSEVVADFYEPLSYPFDIRTKDLDS